MKTKKYLFYIASVVFLASIVALAIRGMSYIPQPQYLYFPIDKGYYKMNIFLQELSMVFIMSVFIAVLFFTSAHFSRLKKKATRHIPNSEEWYLWFDINEISNYIGWASLVLGILSLILFVINILFLFSGWLVHRAIEYSCHVALNVWNIIIIHGQLITFLLIFSSAVSLSALIVFIFQMTDNKTDNA